MNGALPSLLVVLFPVLCVAQQTPPPAPPLPTLTVTSRLVYVDVVVRDSSGHAVHDLNQQDFKVWEDSKLQPIDFFTPHAYHPAVAQTASAPKPAGGNREFSNVVAEGSSSAINILLFDLLNTPASDQIYARQQMLKFLQNLPSGQRIALFVLTQRLRMIQSFTGSSDLLVSAAKMLDAKDFHLLRSESQQMEDADELERLADAMGGRDPGSSVDHTAKDIGRDQAINTDIRARFTLAALAELARATSGYPGRKNLLWLSGSFPLAVGAQMEYNPDAQEAGDMSRDLGHASADLQSQRETANLIASAQIAVYPISLLGIETEGVDPEVRGDAEFTSIGHHLGTDRTGQFTGRQQLRYAMEDLARQTGGQAFFATNDMAGALQHGIEDGSSYYTLAYRPQSGNWNGKFRHIRVELTRKGDALLYRRGYFATPEKPSSDPVQDLNRALQPETPDATMLRLKSRVDPPNAQHPGVLVTSYIDAGDVAFTTGPDGHRHAKLLVLLVAFTEGAKQPDKLPQATGTLNLDLDPDHYQSLLSTGIGFQLALALKPGRYRMRLGVNDLGNHHLGTLDMPVEMTAANAQAR